jgi:hypothetical protein
MEDGGWINGLALHKRKTMFRCLMAWKVQGSHDMEDGGWINGLALHIQGCTGSSSNLEVVLHHKKVRLVQGTAL